MDTFLIKFDLYKNKYDTFNFPTYFLFLFLQYFRSPISEKNKQTKNKTKQNKNKNKKQKTKNKKKKKEVVYGPPTTFHLCL